LDFKEAFAESVTIEDFFHDIVPRMHAERGDFADFSQVDVIVSVFLADTDKRFTLEFRRDGTCEVEDDEMIDFPVITLIGYEKYWPLVKKHAVGLLESLDARKEELQSQYRLTQSFLDAFERYDGSVDVTISGPDGEVEMSLVLNDYERVDGAKQFGFELPLSLVEAVVTGAEEPGKAAKSLKIKGDYGFATVLGGFLLEQFES
jgi:hypothetical protein